MFRNEVIDEKRDRLSGETLIALPISWQAVGYLLFFGLAASIAFLALANYSRVETVSGSLAPDKGIASVLPTRSGTIVEVLVDEGEQVRAGDLLVRIRTEEDSPFGLSSAEQIEQAIGRQDASLALQVEASNASAAAQQRQLAAQQTGLRSEISQIESQIVLQKSLIATAKSDLERANSVAERGFISQRDLQVREEALFARQQGLAQLNQSLSAKRSALAESELSAAQVAAQARAQSANLTAARAQVGQQAASAAAARSYAIRAPIAGTVSASTARVGQPASTQDVLMTIVPAGAELQAELDVPSAAIGFVKEGQEVSVAIDAFPYQRFGSIKGEVLSVAASALRREGANGSSVSVYPVRVKLRASSVQAFGRSEPLVPGMTLSARIVTEKQSLLEWLFEPLFAVSRR